MTFTFLQKSSLRARNPCGPSGTPSIMARCHNAELTPSQRDSLQGLPGRSLRLALHREPLLTPRFTTRIGRFASTSVPPGVATRCRSPKRRACKQRVARELSNQLSDDADAPPPHTPTRRHKEKSAAEPPRPATSSFGTKRPQVQILSARPRNRRSAAPSHSGGGLLLPAYSSDVQQLPSFQGLPQPAQRLAGRVRAGLRVDPPSSPSGQRDGARA
jgi:hypothetical protein